MVYNAPNQQRNIDIAQAAAEKEFQNLHAAFGEFVAKKNDVLIRLYQ